MPQIPKCLQYVECLNSQSVYSMSNASNLNVPTVCWMPQISKCLQYVECLLKSQCAYSMLNATHLNVPTVCWMPQISMCLQYVECLKSQCAYSMLNASNLNVPTVWLYSSLGSTRSMEESVYTFNRPCNSWLLTANLSFNLRKHNKLIYICINYTCTWWKIGKYRSIRLFILVTDGITLSTVKRTQKLYNEKQTGNITVHRGWENVTFHRVVMLKYQVIGLLICGELGVYKVSIGLCCPWGYTSQCISSSCHLCWAHLSF